MAEINIERRSSHAVWWVVGLVALLLVAWLVWRGMTPNTTISGVSSIGPLIEAGRVTT